MLKLVQPRILYMLKLVHPPATRWPHARTHTRTHARTHSITHAHTHAFSHARTHAHTPMASHRRIKQSINQSINQSIKLSPCDVTVLDRKSRRGIWLDRGVSGSLFGTFKIDVGQVTVLMLTKQVPMRHALTW